MAQGTTRGLFRSLFWQQNEFRSSFPECVGKQTSFGVVKALPAHPGDLSRGNLRPLKGRSPSILLLKQQNLTPHKTGRRSRSEIITPKLVWLPSGPRDYSETRFAANGTWGTMDKSPRSLPGPLLTPTQEGLRLSLSPKRNSKLNAYRQPKPLSPLLRDTPGYGKEPAFDAT